MASWIRVEDRLPDNSNDLVLAAYADGSVGMACGSNIGLNIDYGKQYPEDTTIITHWMPLPEPPNEVKTNIFDHEDIYHDCSVQILTNTTTGETSVGWWRNGRN